MSSQWVPGQRVIRPTVPEMLGDHDERINKLQRGDVGIWHYATPIAPAPDPDDLLIPDADSTPFLSAQNKQVTLPGGSPEWHQFRYRIHPMTVLELDGAIQLNEPLPCPVIVLPARFRPAKPCIVVCTDGDGLTGLSFGVEPGGLVQAISFL